MKKNPNIFDILLVLFILSFVFVVQHYISYRRDRAYYTTGDFVRISTDGKKDEIIPIPSDGKKIFHYVKPGFLVEVSSSGARVMESDCPHKVCVRSGTIHRRGDAIVCVPNKISLTIINKDDNAVSRSDYDAVTR